MLLRPSVLLGAASLSAALCIAAATGLLRHELAFAFKPLTTALLIAYAFPRGKEVPRQRRFVLIGLVLSLVGDVALLWPQQGFLPGLVAFLLAHLAYTAAFCVPVRLAARPAWFAGYAALALLILSQLWYGVPNALRGPVIAYVVCLATMAAQAAVWWRSAAEGQRLQARHAALGGLFFLASDSLLAFNKFDVPLPLSALWILSTYWVAQALIASSLPTGPHTGR